MGQIISKLTLIAEYCDCLQNWDKFDIPGQDNKFDLEVSSVNSNLYIQKDNQFDIQKIDNCFDKEMIVVKNRIKERKKIKSQIIQQMQLQRQVKQQKQKQQQRQRLTLEKKQKKRKQRQKKQQQQKKQQSQRKKQQQQIKKQQQQRKRQQQQRKKQQQKKQKRQKRHNRKKSHLQIIKKKQIQTDNTQLAQNKIKQLLSDTQIPQEEYRKYKKKKVKKQFEYDVEIFDFDKIDQSQMQRQVEDLVQAKFRNQHNQYTHGHSLPLQLKPIQVSSRGKHRYDRDDLRIKNIQDNSLSQASQVPSFDDASLIIQKNKRSSSYFLNQSDKEQYLMQ